MIEHISYECEICHRSFPTAALAQQCENSTLPEPTEMEIGKRYRHRWYFNRTAKLMTLYLGVHSLSYTDDSVTGHDWWGGFDAMIKGIDHYE